jgi:copper type II ascorbate-dependent monooxygenase-like protein
MISARSLLVLAALASVTAFGQPTFSKEVSRIMQAKCGQCHRDGDIAPFSVATYATVSAWSDDIKRDVSGGVMPPWKPVAGHGEFRDSFALTDDEKQTILDWIDAGVPEGDPADMPAAADDKSPWPLGDPDQVLSMIQEFTPPRGTDVYRCFVLPANFDNTQYLSAVDVLPGNRQIVHHVLLFTDTTGQAAQMDGQDGEPGYPCFGGPGFALQLNGTLGGWAPGQRSRFLPDGIGIEVTKGARIVMQVHYFPVGRTGPDQTQVGLYYSKKDIQQRLFMIPIVNQTFKIPAGESSYNVNAQFRVTPLLDSKVIWVYPHMHLLGRKINVDVTDSKGNVRPMILEDNWDFNWQGSYTYTEPMAVPNGSTVKLTCTFDNSDTNPKNPNNPLVDVTWGERTTDEMCLVFMGVTLDYEKLLPLRRPGTANR